MTKHVEIPQTQHTDKVVDVPAVMQRQAPQIHGALKTVEVPQAQLVCQVTKHVEIPPNQHIEKVFEVPVATLQRGPQVSLRALGTSNRGAHRGRAQVMLCTAMQLIDEQIADTPVPLTQARLVEILIQRTVCGRAWSTATGTTR